VECKPLALVDTDENRRKFAAGTNTRTAKFFRSINEIPMVAAIFMVIAVTVFVRSAG